MIGRLQHRRIPPHECIGRNVNVLGRQVGQPHGASCDAAQIHFVVDTLGVGSYVGQEAFDDCIGMLDVAHDQIAQRRLRIEQVRGDANARQRRSQIVRHAHQHHASSLVERRPLSRHRGQCRAQSFNFACTTDCFGRHFAAADRVDLLRQARHRAHRPAAGEPRRDQQKQDQQTEHAPDSRTKQRRL